MVNYTVSTRIEKQSTGNEKGLLWHNVRAADNVKNIRDDSKNIKVFRFNNGSLQFLETNTKNKSQNIKTLKLLQDTLDNLDMQIEQDYKNHHGKKIPKNVVKMIRGVVTFGTDREKSLGEETKSLTDEEIEHINSKDSEEMDKAALAYMRSLESEFGIKVAYITRHDDEKTRHYHFTATQYNFKNHKTLTSGFKKRDMQVFGEKLQDLVYFGFKDMGFQRGQKGSDAKHLDIVDMHKNEISSITLTKMELNAKLDDLNIHLDTKTKEVEDSKELVKNSANSFIHFLDKSVVKTITGKHVLTDFNDFKSQTIRFIKKTVSQNLSFKNHQKILDDSKQKDLTIQAQQDELNKVNSTLEDTRSKSADKNTIIRKLNEQLEIQYNSKKSFSDQEVAKVTQMYEKELEELNTTLKSTEIDRNKLDELEKLEDFVKSNHSDVIEEFEDQRISHGRRSRH